MPNKYGWGRHSCERDARGVHCTPVPVADRSHDVEALDVFIHDWQESSSHSLRNEFAKKYATAP